VIYFLATAEVIYLVMAYEKHQRQPDGRGESRAEDADPTTERRGVT
jgi:hypothetical protein